MFKERDKERAVKDKVQDNKNRVKEHYKMMWQRYTYKTFVFISVRMILAVAAVLTMMTNLVSPIVAIPTFLYFLGIACIRFGMWFSKYTNRKS